MTEDAIGNPGDVHLLNGETLLRNRDGCIDTYDVDLARRERFF